MGHTGVPVNKKQGFLERTYDCVLTVLKIVERNDPERRTENESESVSQECHKNAE